MKELRIEPTNQRLIYEQHSSLEMDLNEDGTKTRDVNEITNQV